VKVVLLSTAPAETPASFARLREQLGLDEAYAAQLVLVTWLRPRVALPAHRALLVGPPVAVSGRAVALPVSPDDVPDAPDHAAAPETPTDTSTGVGTASATGLVGTLLRVARKIAPDVLGSRFALACLRKPEVREEVGSADVVVALDVHTYRAGWLLARLHEAPEFVAGTGACRRVIAERAASHA
jgi:hypothetical protein